MGVAARLSVVTLTSAGLVLGTLGGLPAAGLPMATQATITCSITEPGDPVETLMDTPVDGNVTCVHSDGLPVTYSVEPFVIDKYGPLVGKLTLDRSTGDFRYSPGWYPPDENGNHDRLPEYTGTDSFRVNARADDGVKGSITVPIRIIAPPRPCIQDFSPKSRIMFNNPAGSPKKQYRMLRYLLKMIDCTPPKNPDGSRATIKFSFFSLSYAPVQAALSAAAERGVAVQAITNSHSDKYGSWQELAKDLGGDSTSSTFATTCWQGCLTPRKGPVEGGPTAWYAADSTTLTSKTVVFSDRSIPGDREIVSWKYTFGDGTSASGPGPHVKKYDKYGNYATKLTVTDSAGVKHTTYGNKTLPDNKEKEYPSLHAKIYLFSTVGTGAQQKRWVSAYSSGNPTYYQSRKGFNNINISVGDKPLYKAFENYMGDLVKASRGELFSSDYFRTVSTSGKASTGSPATTIHFGPQVDTDEDINRDMVRSIQCRYRDDGVLKRTYVRVSMFVFTRKGVARDLWRKAMREGCRVEIVYTQMSQRLRGADGKWLRKADGSKTSWGVADCLATPPSRVVVKPATATRPAIRVVRKNSLRGDDGVLCSEGTLKGSVPVTSTGMWLNRTSPFGGGRLRVRMSCPVAPKYDSLNKTWTVACIRNDIYTHNKAMLVRGVIHGRHQKFVMSGSANWSQPGLRSSDEIITEMQKAPAVYDRYKTNYDYLKRVVAKNSSTQQRSLTYRLQVSDGQQVNVRGMTDEQLRDGL